MYRKICILATAGLFLTACGDSSDKQEQAKSETATSEEVVGTTEMMSGSVDMTEAQKRAYALGANSAGFIVQGFSDFESWGMSIDKDYVKKGFVDAIDNNSQMAPEELQAVLMGLQQEIQQKVAEIEQEQMAKTAEANQTFLDTNAAKEGVMVTESGIQYRILREGDGPNPTAEDTVQVHYKGTLIDGSPFDSSYDRGQPVNFPLNRVIAGWTEGIQLVKQGGQIELVIPPELGYGSQPPPGAPIPPNSILIFEVELLDINPEPEEPVKPEAEVPSEG